MMYMRNYEDVYKCWWLTLLRFLYYSYVPTICYELYSHPCCCCCCGGGGGVCTRGVHILRRGAPVVGRLEGGDKSFSSVIILFSEIM